MGCVQNASSHYGPDYISVRKKEGSPKRRGTAVIEFFQLLAWLFKSFNKKFEWRPHKIPLDQSDIAILTHMHDFPRPTSQIYSITTRKLEGTILDPRSI